MHFAPEIGPIVPKPPINPKFRPGFVPPKEVAVPGVGPVPITVIAVIVTLGLVTFALMSMAGR